MDSEEYPALVPPVQTRPVPPVEEFEGCGGFECCHCGGTGTDPAGDPCEHCETLGRC